MYQNSLPSHNIPCWLLSTGFSQDPYRYFTGPGLRDMSPLTIKDKNVFGKVLTVLDCSVQRVPRCLFTGMAGDLRPQY